MQNKPKLSIVMAAYNGDKYIASQIESIQAQTYSDWELIIVDDCSTDGTRDVINDYARNDKRIRSYFNDINIGVIKNFEKGLSLAAGELISFADDDDQWSPNKLAAQIKYLDDFQDIGVSYHDLKICDENLANTGMTMRQKLAGNWRSLHKFDVRDDTIKALSRENHLTGCSIMFRAALLPQILPIPGELLHDHWIALIGAAYSKNGYIDMAPILYRQHASNAVGAKVRGFKYYLSLLNSKEQIAQYIESAKSYALALATLVQRGQMKTDDKRIVEGRISSLNSIIKMLQAQGVVNVIMLFIKSAKIIINSKQMYHFNILFFYFFAKLSPIKK